MKIEIYFPEFYKGDWSIGLSMSNLNYHPTHEYCIDIGLFFFCIWIYFKEKPGK